jgi:hypothetical protein
MNKLRSDTAVLGHSVAYMFDDKSDYNNDGYDDKHTCSQRYFSCPEMIGK